MTPCVPAKKAPQCNDCKRFRPVVNGHSNPRLVLIDASTLRKWCGRCPMRVVYEP